MVGAGADAVSAQRRASRSAEMGDNEKTLMHIARQVRGKDWTSVFQAADAVEQIVAGLKRLSIYVLGTGLRPCITKYGN
jgi:hypothetical protein